MTITHVKAIRATSLPTHLISFEVLNAKIQSFLTENNLIQKHYKIRDSLDGSLFIYLVHNGRIEVEY